MTIIASHSPALNAIICEPLSIADIAIMEVDKTIAEVENLKSCCQFPLCKNHAVREGFCLHHAKHFASEPEPKPKKAIKIKSIKRVAEDVILKKMFKERFALNQNCELRIPGVCTGVAQGFDHIQKTSPANRLLPTNLKMACNACNGAKEGAEGQQYAKDNGLHVSRFKKVSV